jgi:hypothetical protein
MKINRAWLNDLMNLLEEGLIAMELKSIRIDELEAALREIIAVDVTDPWSAAGTMKIKARAALEMK